IKCAVVSSGAAFQFQRRKQEGFQRQGGRMSIASDNLNLNLGSLNLNLNLGATATDGSLGFGGPRYNSEDFPKYAPTPPAVRWPVLSYSSDWDPGLRTWRYVQEFISDGGWMVGPITDVRTYIEANGSFPVPSVTLTQAGLANEVLGVLNASIDRADRALEILDQASGMGALHYWTG